MAWNEVWWIRHGESVRNAGLPTVDTYSAPMTERGVREAHEAAAALPGEPDLIVHSSFLRARQTAEPMRARFPSARTDERDVHEYHFLCDVKTRNTTRRDREPMVASYWDRCDPEHVEGVGAESFRGFIERIDRAVDLLRREGPSWSVVCTHHHFMLGLLMRLREPGATVDRTLMAKYRSVVLTVDVPNGALVRTALETATGRTVVGAVEPLGSAWKRLEPGSAGIFHPLGA